MTWSGWGISLIALAGLAVAVIVAAVDFGATLVEGRQALRPVGQHRRATRRKAPGRPAAECEDAARSDGLGRQ